MQQCYVHAVPAFLTALNAYTGIIQYSVATPTGRKTLPAVHANLPCIVQLQGECIPASLLQDWGGVTCALSGFKAVTELQRVH